MFLKETNYVVVEKSENSDVLLLWSGFSFFSLSLVGGQPALNLGLQNC